MSQKANEYVSRDPTVYIYALQEKFIRFHS